VTPRTLTTVFIAAVAFLIVAWDVLMYLTEPNDEATISAVIRSWARTLPGLSFVIAFGLGMLVFHLFLCG
jgi:hypothetical protein